MERRDFLKVVLGACFLSQLPVVDYIYYHQCIDGKWKLHEELGLRGTIPSVLTDFEGIIDGLWVFERQLTLKEIKICTSIG